MYSIYHGLTTYCTCFHVLCTLGTGNQVSTWYKYLPQFSVVTDFAHSRIIDLFTVRIILRFDSGWLITAELAWFCRESHAVKATILRACWILRAWSRITLTVNFLIFIDYRLRVRFLKTKDYFRISISTYYLFLFWELIYLLFFNIIFMLFIFRTIILL